MFYHVMCYVPNYVYLPLLRVQSQCHRRHLANVLGLSIGRGEGKVHGKAGLVSGLQTEGYTRYLGLGEAAAVRRGRGRGHRIDSAATVAAAAARAARRGRQRPGLAEGREGRRLVQDEVGDVVEEGGGVVRQVGQVEQRRRLDA